MKALIRPILLGSLLIGAAIAPAQSDTINFETTIGSFKLIDGKGTVSFSFQGTVLLVGAEGNIKMEGAVKKEFDDPKMKRTSYFGKGKLTIVGKWRGIQWFGSNMKGFIKGESLVRLTGEFDKNLDTGFYWYGDRIKDRNPWFTSGLTVKVPEDPRLNPKPTRRGGYGGG
jgi:hypothetical protein